MEFPKRDSAILNKLRLERDKGESERARSRMLLAAKIILGMRSKGWSRTEFAENINKKRSVITKWLSGVHNFTSDTLTDIEQLLGIQLLNLEENTNPHSVNIKASGDITVNILKETVTYIRVSNHAVKLEGIELSEAQIITTTIGEDCPN